MKDYVRTATLRGQEMFVPLMHPAGEAGWISVKRWWVPEWNRRRTTW